MDHLLNTRVGQLPMQINNMTHYLLFVIFRAYKYPAKAAPQITIKAAHSKKLIFHSFSFLEIILVA
jgi:hypothetical protein